VSTKVQSPVEVLTFAEAMAVVDGGGRVCLAGGWVMRKSGFAWGTWIQRERLWTPEDSKRMKERDAAWSEDNLLPPVEASGEYGRVVCTLCETITRIDDDFIKSLDPTGLGWEDVTDRFDGGTPNGYNEYMTGGSSHE